MTDQAPKMLSISAVADMLDVSQSTILRWVRRGEFPAPRKFGRASRWSQQEVLEHIEKAERRNVA